MSSYGQGSELTLSPATDTPSDQQQLYPWEELPSDQLLPIVLKSS